MGSYQVVKLSREPIIVSRFGADYDLVADFPESSKQVSRVFQEQTEPFYYILDISEMKMDFSQVVMRLADLTDPKSGPYRHPLLKEIILVTQADLGVLLVDAMHQEQYGALQGKLCSSEEEAIEYVRSKITM